MLCARLVKRVELWNAAANLVRLPRRRVRDNVAFPGPKVVVEWRFVGACCTVAAIVKNAAVFTCGDGETLIRSDGVNGLVSMGVNVLEGGEFVREEREDTGKGTRKKGWPLRKASNF